MFLIKLNPQKPQCVCLFGAMSTLSAKRKKKASNGENWLLCATTGSMCCMRDLVKGKASAIGEHTAERGHVPLTGLQTDWQSYKSKQKCTKRFIPTSLKYLKLDTHFCYWRLWVDVAGCCNLLQLVDQLCNRQPLIRVHLQHGT